jgi:hypothetical protein
MDMSMFAKSSATLPSSFYKNPPIPFVSKYKKIEKVNGDNTDKTEIIKIEFFINP